MNVCHVQSSYIVQSRNAACTMVATFIQLVEPSVLSQVESISHRRRCFAFIPNELPQRLRHILITAHAISSSSGMDSSTGNYCTPTGIGCASGGTFRYSSNCSAVMVAIAPLVRVGG